MAPAKGRAGGKVWVGDFAYIQGEADTPKELADPSAAATADPIQAAAAKKAEAEKTTPRKDGQEKEDEKLKKDPVEDAKVQKEEDQAKAQGAAIKVLDAVNKAPAEPLAADEGVAWDQRAGNDAARKAAAATVAAQPVAENKNVDAIKKDIATATAAAAKD